MFKKIGVLVISLLMLAGPFIFDGSSSDIQARECCDTDNYTKLYFLGQWCCFTGWSCTPCVVCCDPD